MNAQTAVIETQNLAKSFRSGEREFELFKSLNLRVEAGETLAIIGKSGAGKSTLLSLLAGLDTPTSGTISLDGQRLDTLDDATRATLRSEQIAFIFQSFHLLPELDAQANVALPLEIRNDPQAMSKAAQWLEKVGLGQRLDHTPSQLSGGEQQRVAIARAFAGEPKVLFADEPTGNLDEDTGNQIIDQLFAFNQQQGTTLILITHDRELAARCQRRILLANGTLEEI
jgi:putative ABC transport system ATP-binding protein